VSGPEYQSVPGLLVTFEGGVLRCQIDNPKRRNALDDVSIAALIASVEQARVDDDVRVVVVEATGDDFCSGFDIVARNAGAEGRPRAGSIQRRLPTQAHHLIPLLLDVQVPVVAVVRGWAAGLGFQLALAADFAVAATNARFWQPFSRRGFSPDSGATWLLPRLAGPVRARELLLLGRELSGQEAAEWHLIHEAVPGDELDPVAGELIERLAAAPTVAIGLTKWLLGASPDADLHQQLANEGFAMELSSRADDFREGLTAFREKRDPRFTGR
jgi:2-(1,2-epoxy-1,2-dihydrophenyl)acetyl-CoA isomerase